MDQRFAERYSIGVAQHPFSGHNLLPSIDDEHGDTV